MHPGLWSWPQWIYVGFMVFAWLTACSKKGEPRDAYDPNSTLVSVAIAFGMLWWGGFFP